MPLVLFLRGKTAFLPLRNLKYMTNNNFKIFQLFDEIDHKTLRHYMGWRYFYFKIIKIWEKEKGLQK
jgi:hypothetical protein